jgi:hypothetical protein
VEREHDAILLDFALRKEREQMDPRGRPRRQAGGPVQAQSPRGAWRSRRKKTLRSLTTGAREEKVWKVRDALQAREDARKPPDGAGGRRQAAANTRASSQCESRRCPSIHTNSSTRRERRVEKERQDQQAASMVDNNVFASCSRSSNKKSYNSPQIGEKQETR